MTVVRETVAGGAVVDGTVAGGTVVDETVAGGTVPEGATDLLTRPLASGTRVRRGAVAAAPTPGWRFAVGLGARYAVRAALVPSVRVPGLPAGVRGWVLHRRSWRQELWLADPADGTAGAPRTVSETVTTVVLTARAQLVRVVTTEVRGAGRDDDDLAVAAPAADEDLLALDVPTQRRERRFRAGRVWHVEVDDAPVALPPKLEPGAGVLAAMARATGTTPAVTV